jgi:hypothetical protein
MSKGRAASPPRRALRAVDVGTLGPNSWNPMHTCQDGHQPRSCRLHSRPVVRSHPTPAIPPVATTPPLSQAFFVPQPLAPPALPTCDVARLPSQRLQSTSPAAPQPPQLPRRSAAQRSHPHRTIPPPLPRASRTSTGLIPKQSPCPRSSEA